MNTPVEPIVDEAKEAQRAVWELGDYAKVADTVIPDLGRVLVDACNIGPQDEVIDIACGAGNAALPAAERGASVTACDLSPLLLDECARRAGNRGLTITCTPADAEALPYPDNTFDVALSCVGVMFAPNHQAAADELIRVVRPGGQVGLLNWTPTGFIGELFATMRPFLPPPPPGAQPPPRWGDPAHLDELLDGRLHDLSTKTAAVAVDCFNTPTQFSEFFTTYYGPTVAAARRLADNPARRIELDQALTDLAHQHWTDDDQMHWEYLVLTGTKR